MKFERKTMLDYAQITVGAFVTALSFNYFFIPANIVPGGFTGLASIIAFLTKLPVGLLSACLNIPLFLLNFKSSGLGSFVRSVTGTLLLSLFLDVLPVAAVTQDMLLTCVIGGVLMGAGLGLVIRGNATTGGTDLAAVLICHKLRALQVSWVIFALDFSIVAFAVLIHGLQHALYACIALFLSAKVIDAILEGLNSAKTVFIISPKNDAIANRILVELSRGVTSLDCRGVYSGESKTMLLCSVGRFEIARLKQIVKDADPTAFVIVNNAHEILGEGFNQHK